MGGMELMDTCPNLLPCEWTILEGIRYDTLLLAHVHMTRGRNLYIGTHTGVPSSLLILSAPELSFLGLPHK